MILPDDFRIDSHKLIFHPERVSSWLKGENIYPICIEISPSGSCNHRCIFCGLDYLGYKPAFLDKDLILGNFREMAPKGLKSVVVCGEGEPLLNKNTPEIIQQTKSFGIDVAMSSNGVLFSKEIARECLGSLTWIRFSVNAGTDDTHQIVHRGKPGDFEKVLQNLQDAVRTKKERKLATTIGVQMLLIPENYQDVLVLAGKLKEIGVDYFTVKPFSQHPKSSCTIDPDFNYQDYLDLEMQLNEMVTESYRIIFRSGAMKKKKQGRCYNRCLGLPFWAYIDANAEVWACIAYIGDKDFSYGILKDHSFVEMWEGKGQKEVLARVANMSISGCRELCRLDEINTYLHQLKNPGEHVNFI